MAKPTKQFAANPHFGSEFASLVRSPRPPTIGSNRVLWSICELCGRQTEFAVAIEAIGIYKRTAKGGAVAVPFTNQMRTEARGLADELVARYEQAIAGLDELNTPADMLLAYCDMQEMRGDFSVESFRDQVERAAEYSVWARHGDISSTPQLSGQRTGRQRPSKIYCDFHYPGRSVAARRAYQRDRKFFAEYEAIVDQLWKLCAGHLPQWNVDSHVLVRDAAYYWIRITKAPTRRLNELHGPAGEAVPHMNGKTIESYYDKARRAYQRLMQLLESKDWLDQIHETGGHMTQSDLARRLGVSRQAVSAALKKMIKDPVPEA